MAPRAHYHILAGLQPQKYILSQLWRPDTEFKVSARACALHRYQGRLPPASSSIWELQAALGMWLHPSHVCLDLYVASESLLFCVL